MPINLSGKEVPKKYYRNYSMKVTPDSNHLLDKDGFTNERKTMTFRLILDKLNHVHILPTEMKVSEDGQTIVEVPIYNLADIVAAASGDPDAIAKIEGCNQRLREELNCDAVLTPEWCNGVVGGVRNKFINAYNKTKASRGEEQNAADEVPYEATTYEDLTPQDVQILAASARPSKSGAANKYTPSEQGGNAQ